MTGHSDISCLKIAARRKHIVSWSFLTVLAISLCSNLPPAAGAPSPAWQTTWTSPIDFAGGVTSNSTTRDIATVAVGGSSLEFTFSNLWSTTSTTFSAVTVGVQQNGVVVTPGTIVPVTFNSRRSVTIAPHAQVTSDPVAMTVHAGESLAISIAVTGSATVSVHYCCEGRIDSYATSNGAGDFTQIPSSPAFNPQLPNWTMRWLSAIAVGGSAAQGTIVAFGDSITDGYGYMNNGFSWVNALQSRIDQLPASQQMSVVNEGISGNTLTIFPSGATFAELSGGLPGDTRFESDALSLAGVKAIVVLLGTNDIWFGAGGHTGYRIPPYGTAPSIEAGMHQLVVSAHAKGLKIFGLTLLPRATSTKADYDLPENWTPDEQAILSAVNTWILSPSSGFDGVINLGELMGNVYNGACQPTTPFAAFFNPDHLHPNVAGQRVMADAIPTTLFGMPQAPQIPQVITATATAGCAGGQLASQILAAGSVPATTTTTTAPVTTTTKLLRLHGSRAHAKVTYLIVALIILSLALMISARRRTVRRMAASRRSLRRPERPRMETSRQRPPPRR